MEGRNLVLRWWPKSGWGAAVCAPTSLTARRGPWANPPPDGTSNDVWER